MESAEPFKDHFSAHAVNYAKFRPHYPEQLFHYLASIVSKRDVAWDCGTGNGQAATALAKCFGYVIATDASKQQIANAKSHGRVEYRVAPAEASGLETETIDLITVAQALHWFDLSRFYEEAKRVLKPDGITAAWAYTLLHVTPEIDAVVTHYYYNVVGMYWPPERLLVEKFDKLAFPFAEIPTPSFQMAAQWNLIDLLGYLRTWSATQRFVAQNQADPLEYVAKELEIAWGPSGKKRNVAWPLTLRIGYREI